MDSMADGQGRRLGDGGRFTKESPFEFKGVKVWREATNKTFAWVHYAGDGVGTGGTFYPEALPALHAFIKAERSPWQPITFADVKVGDKIKSESTCGTVRRGVVAEVYSGQACDEDGTFLAHPSWTLYRRAPKPAKFVPLDVPEVGQWGEFTMADGRVLELTVEVVARGVNSQNIRSGSHSLHIDTERPECDSCNRIVSWRPIDPPAPEEPTKWGLVGHVTDPGGRVSSIYRRVNTPGERYASVSHTNGLATYCPDWRGVLALGTFTAATK